MIKEEDHLPLKVELIKPTNYYILSLPFITMVIVVCSAIVSIKTVNKKSDEAINAITEANKTQLKISDKTIQANEKKSRESVIADNRQDWINNLRDELSELTSQIICFGMNEATEKVPERRYIYLETIWSHYHKIQLMLNEKEQDHKDLDVLIKNSISKLTQDDNNVHESTKLIINKSREILKREWERVKKFD